ncbi:MAG: hypothetical protein DPW13_15355 [Planctomycetes bacterium]|nr:hypothetical protein [Planctomycetota bacterium]
MRRTHLREHPNILKRLLIHAAGFNLSLILRKILGWNDVPPFHGPAAMRVPWLSGIRAGGVESPGHGALRGRPAASFRASGGAPRNSGARLDGLESWVGARGCERAAVRLSGAPRSFSRKTPEIQPVPSRPTGSNSPDVLLAHQCM